jgi:hypothetical protein
LKFSASTWQETPIHGQNVKPNSLLMAEFARKFETQVQHARLLLHGQAPQGDARWNDERVGR